MNSAPQTTRSPKDVVRLLVVHAPRWMIPTAILGAVALGYALWRPPTWEASQALIIRNEEKRRAIVTASTPEEILQLFADL